MQNNTISSRELIHHLGIPYTRLAGWNQTRLLAFPTRIYAGEGRRYGLVDIVAAKIVLAVTNTLNNAALAKKAVTHYRKQQIPRGSDIYITVENKQIGWGKTGIYPDSQLEDLRFSKQPMVSIPLEFYIEETENFLAKKQKKPAEALA